MEHLSQFFSCVICYAWMNSEESGSYGLARNLLGLKHTHVFISFFLVHQYVNSKNARDLKFLTREINTMRPDIKDTFKYHCSAGPWDLKKSQGHHREILL